ncbi:MAG: class I SAM-dependent methyltransferase [Gammaproteobacteria bacterium]|nr:class I SAM-dependent methyltransferase [Gammaproteobacteria bacterium]
MKKLVDRVTYSLLNEAPIALGLPTLYRDYCRVCGSPSRRGRPWKLARGLVESWQIDSRWQRMIERREGLRCGECGSVSRFRYLARVVMDELGAPDPGYGSFADYANSEDFRRLRVAEVNGCGALHKYLDLNPELAYSEYGSEDPAVPSEDLTRLSYGDSEFDLVLTSDTLEHVPDLAGALGEIERILKPGGRHIFTVPAIWDGRMTRRRAVLDGDRIVHLYPPSYHGVWEDRSPDRLVFLEFGDDALDYLRTPGTDIRVRRHPGNPAISVFIAVKAGGPDEAGAG